eukprot:8180023-Heterocapsa_arctica.AAC.1
MNWPSEEKRYDEVAAVVVREARGNAVLRRGVSHSAWACVRIRAEAPRMQCAGYAAGCSWHGSRCAA